MEAKLYGQNKGGMSINGIIKDYYVYAGENISAGDLVEYVNGVAGTITETTTETSVDKQLSTTTRTGSTISAVKLDNNRVFIAHGYGSDSHLYGVVCTINGATITKGTDTVLSSNKNAGYKISTCYLTNGRVFIAHSYGNYQHLYGIVVSISGATISKGTDTQLVTGNYYGAVISVCKLTTNSVFVAHGTATSGGDLHGIVVTTSGTTITTGTDTVLVSSGVSESISTCLLSNGNVFIAHSLTSGKYYLYGIVCSVNGTTITKGTDTAINNSTQYTGVRISTCLLPNGNVFIAHGVGATTDTAPLRLYGVVCKVSGTTISKGTDTQLSSIMYTGEIISLCVLNNEKVLIVHSHSGSVSRCLYGMVVKINGTTITAGNDIELASSKYSGYAISSAMLNGKIFVAHTLDSTNYYLYAQVWGIDETNNVPTNNISVEKITTEYETQVRKVTTPQFDGIAKTEGIGGDETGHKDIVSIWTKE